MIYDEFKGTKWKTSIDVEDFIKENYTEYLGDDSFLKGTTIKTNKLWKKCEVLLKKELKKGVLDVELEQVSGINSFKPGYIDKKNEVIFGLQTDKPLKRIVNPYGGIRMVHSALNSYGYKLNDNINSIFNTHRKTHNDGVFQLTQKK